MKTGDIVQGFRIIDAAEIPQLGAGKADSVGAVGIWARHEKTGLEVYHILNDDEENLFAFGFLTPPSDSTGAAHIIEHSVLCGSQNFPSKDPFLQLSRQSIKTFLNAFTFPDKTVYPASSMVEADYFNLMAVYGDAVFFPLLRKWTFEQEAHRLELDDKGNLSIQGVVYNEMKGNYSTLENIAGDRAMRTILPGTPYAFDSGGDPEAIPDLTLEEFRQFHAKWYHPANCRLFLCGNIPTEKQFAFLEERFLSFPFPESEFRVAPGEKKPPRIPLAEPFDAPQVMEIPAPSGGSGSTVILSWLLGESADMVTAMEASFISEILLGHDGSPLSRALVESGLGEDLAPSTGLETEIRQMVFSVGLRGMEKNDSGKLRELIFSVLEDIQMKGVPEDEIEAAVMSIEFSNREVRRSSGPFSLTLMRRSLKGWLHGHHPRTTLLNDEAFGEVKKRLAEQPGYLSGLISRFFLANNHQLLLTVYPDPGYEAGVEERLNERLAGIKAALDEKGREKLIEEQRELQRIQQIPDSAELQARIPHLKPSDLSLRPDRIIGEQTKERGVPLFLHEQETNGIGYLDIGLPVDILPPEDYLYLPFFSFILTSVGFDGLNWAEASGRIARVTGGFFSSLFTSSSVPEKDNVPGASGRPEGALIGRDWLFLRSKMLEEKISAAVPVIFSCLASADFSDTRRLSDLILEFRNDFAASLVPSGNHYAASRASRLFSRSKAADELWNGLSQLAFSRKLSEMDISAVSSKMTEIRERLISGGIVCNITGTAPVIGSLRGALGAALDGNGSFSGVQAPVPLSEHSSEAFFRLTDMEGASVFTAPMQVGFAAAALPSSPYGTDEAAHETVFAHWLDNTLLWERIRTMGGAYGASSGTDAIEKVFIMSTYRDPNPALSLRSFRECLDESAGMTLDRESLERAITGCYSREIQPRSPMAKGFTGFVRALYGITDELREKKIAALLGTTAEQLRAAAERVAGAYETAETAAVAGEKQAESVKNRFSSGKIYHLPV
ncbi:MAG: insulinase family protein [Spirochaetaceae bacterium]|nr:insulinase family protein [Spirochaetaceae bacterium]